MGSHKSFLIRKESASLVECMNNEQAGAFFKALFAFAEDGVMPGFEDPLMKAAFSVMSNHIIEDDKKWRAKCERNRENIRRRWDEDPVVDQKAFSENNPVSTSVNGCTNSDTNAYDRIPEATTENGGIRTNTIYTDRIGKDRIGKDRYLKEKDKKEKQTRIDEIPFPPLPVPKDISQQKPPDPDGSYFPDFPVLNTRYNEWLRYLLQEHGKRMPLTSIDMQVKSLTAMSTQNSRMDAAKAVDILDYAMRNGWKTLHPIPPERKAKTKTKKTEDTGPPGYDLEEIEKVLVNKV